MIKRRLQTADRADRADCAIILFGFFLNCDSTYNYFFGHYEILQGYLEQANLRFYRNACSVCVKGKLIGQCPSDHNLAFVVVIKLFFHYRII